MIVYDVQKILSAATYKTPVVVTKYFNCSHLQSNVLFAV